jgi:protein gp37
LVKKEEEVSESFLRAIKEGLEIRAKGRKVVGGESGFELRDVSAPYIDVFGKENVDLSEKNTFFWKQTFIKSASEIGPTRTTKR